MGCQIRKENSIISWKELKKLTDYLKKKGLDVNCYLFEFGKEFFFEDSIKIDYHLDFFEKSKKINQIINHEVNSKCNLFCLMDSDLFFSEKQYEEIYKHILDLSTTDQKIFFTYNLRDIDQTNRIEIINHKDTTINYDVLNNSEDKLSWRHSWGAGVLGGFFIVPMNELKQVGGFNENFLTWGGEDDEAQVRIKSLCSWEPQLNFGPYHLWHPKNETDRKYFIPVYSEEYFQINKVDKPS